MVFSLPVLARERNQGQPFQKGTSSLKGYLGSHTPHQAKCLWRQTTSLIVKAPIQRILSSVTVGTEMIGPLEGDAIENGDQYAGPSPDVPGLSSTLAWYLQQRIVSILHLQLGLNPGAAYLLEHLLNTNPLFHLRHTLGCSLLPGQDRVPPGACMFRSPAQGAATVLRCNPFCASLV